MTIPFHLSLAVAGLALLVAVSIRDAEIADAQTMEDIFSANNRSCPRNSSGYAKDEIYGTKPILLTLEELRTNVYPLGKQGYGTERHHFCAHTAASVCADLYWCWPNKQKLSQLPVPPPPIKPTPGKDNDLEKKISDACRKNPQSYTCLFGHKARIAKKSYPMEPIQSRIEKADDLCLEEPWTTWRDDWDQKVWKITAQALSKFAFGDPNSYQIQFRLRLDASGKVVAWASNGSWHGKNPAGEKTLTDMRNWALEELKKIQALPFPEGTARESVERTPAIYHNMRNKAGRDITGNTSSPVPQEPPCQ